MTSLACSRSLQAGHCRRRTACLAPASLLPRSLSSLTQCDVQLGELAFAAVRSFSVCVFCFCFSCFEGFLFFLFVGFVVLSFVGLWFGFFWGKLFLFLFVSFFFVVIYSCIVHVLVFIFSTLLCSSSLHLSRSCPLPLSLLSFSSPPPFSPFLVPFSNLSPPIYFTAQRNKGEEDRLLMLARDHLGFLVEAGSTEEGCGGGGRDGK